MANEAIDWSRYMEGLQGKANTDNTNLTGNADGVIDYQVNEDGSWYRQWKSGWLEQGGKTLHFGTAKTKYKLSFLKNFSNLDYYFNRSIYTEHGQSYGGIYAGATISGKEIDGVIISTASQDNGDGSWYACGMGGV